MEREQESEWLEAQKIVISEDLVAAAKQQLEFLAVVDRRRFLYDGPLRERAIHRYKTCWLPLLARYTESGDPDESLTVPLDCEWVWHCHRLNPVQYKKDCEKFYGRVLDNKIVQSTLQTKSKHQTAELWAIFYPDEPFELDCRSPSTANFNKYAETLNTITYDLVSAVKRQSSFYYQVCRPIMHDERFLDGAVSRYKGFLHLIKRNRENSMTCFCVPTYDVDLMWHSHQLQPISYQKDMVELLGKVLEHDDTDSDRTKGKKLDTGFSETTKQWENAYGLRYWRAGAMHRGATLPLFDATTPLLSSFNQTNTLLSHKPEISLPFQRAMVLEVLLEIVGIRNLPADQKGNVFVSFSKKKPDMFLNGGCHLSIFSETGEKKVAAFECEPVGDIVLNVMTKSKPAKTIGTVSISLEELMDPNAKLSVEKWFELKLHNRQANSNPVYLHVAASFTVPVPSPHVFEMLKLHPFSMNGCKFPLPGTSHPMRSWAHFVDGYGNDIISLQKSKLKETGGRKHSIWKQNIFGMTKLPRKSHLLAEYVENTWSFKDSNLSISVEQNASDEGHMLELKGFGQLKLFPGRKLEYQPRNAMQAKAEDFMTVVESSAENPYGRAIALLDMKSGIVKVSEDWFVLPALVLEFILSDLLKKGGPITVTHVENLKGISSLDVKDRDDYTSAESVVATESASTVAVAKSFSYNMGCGDKENSANAGSCGSGCGGDCGSMAKSGGCGGGGCGSCGADVYVSGAKQASGEVTPVGV